MVIHIQEICLGFTEENTVLLIEVFIQPNGSLQKVLPQHSQVDPERGSRMPRNLFYRTSAGKDLTDQTHFTKIVALFH